MSTTQKTPKEGDLRVWWKPQIPMKPSFLVNVATPTEAKKLLNVLADYDLFQWDNKIKPDYCNAGGLCIFEGDEWVDWHDPETDLGIDEWEPQGAEK